jgi:hypothetical protein
MAPRVASETPGLPLSTRETVASLTPTFCATSVSRRFMAASLEQFYASTCKK